MRYSNLLVKMVSEISVGRGQQNDQSTDVWSFCNKGKKYVVYSGRNK